MLNDMVALPTIAYFSMEIALESHIPTYSGGLGILAGDTLRSAAALRLPMVGVTRLHRKGYGFQPWMTRGANTRIRLPGRSTISQLRYGPPYDVRGAASEPLYQWCH